MTLSDQIAHAYMSGFRKAAESYGVDPQELVKAAGMNWLGRLRGFFRRPTAQQALTSYAAKARGGMAPSNAEAISALDKTLSEYFGRNVPKGLRESILQPMTTR